MRGFLEERDRQLVRPRMVGEALAEHFAFAEDSGSDFAVVSLTL